MLFSPQRTQRTQRKSGLVLIGLTFTPLVSRITQRNPGVVLIGLTFVSLVSFVVMNTAILAAATAQEMYLAALSREQAVRAALADADDDVSLRAAAAARAAVRDYQ